MAEICASPFCEREATERILKMRNNQPLIEYFLCREHTEEMFERLRVSMVVDVPLTLGGSRALVLWRRLK